MSDALDPQHAAASTPGGAGAAETTVAESPLEWSVDPWRERARHAGVAVIFVGVLTVLALRLSGSLLAGGLLAILAFLSLAPAFLVIHCRVDADGVQRRMLGLDERRPWAAIRSARLGPGGLFVSPGRRPGVLDSFRALTLPFPQAPDRLTTLRAELRKRIAGHGL